jgi:hypothetical protein
LKKDLSTVLHRSVVRSAADANNQNKRVTFKPDVQEMIEELDVTSNNVPRSNLPKQKQGNTMMMRQSDFVVWKA